MKKQGTRVAFSSQKRKILFIPPTSSVFYPLSNSSKTVIMSFHEINFKFQSTQNILWQLLKQSQLNGRALEFFSDKREKLFCFNEKVFERKTIQQITYYSAIIRSISISKCDTFLFCSIEMLMEVSGWV